MNLVRKASRDASLACLGRIALEGGAIVNAKSRSLSDMIVTIWKQDTLGVLSAITSSILWSRSPDSEYDDPSLLIAVANHLKFPRNTGFHHKTHSKP